MTAKLNREYRDSVFRMLFNDKKKLIELYNAIFDTDYGPDTPIDIKTIEDVLFVHMKNDIAFTLDNKFIVLTEHQSTVNPNMPVRNLIYLSTILQKMYKKAEFYQTVPLPLPQPEFIVFYNGSRKMPEYQELKLSDSFLGEKKEKYALDLTVKVFNINIKEDEGILARSATLSQYSRLVEKIKTAALDGEVSERIMSLIFKECINEGILPEFLTEHGLEVINMLFKEFTEEEREELYTQSGYKMGLADGLERGRAEGEASGMAKGKLEAIRKLAGEMKSRNIDVKMIEEMTGLSLEEIAKL